jgi:hypothetical protein
VTGTGLGLKDAAEEKGPIPLGARALAIAHEGLWNGLNPAGYKLVRRVLRPDRAARDENGSLTAPLTFAPRPLCCSSSRRRLGRIRASAWRSSSERFFRSTSW